MFVHGDNLKQKEAHQTKYTDKKSRQYLSHIRVQYEKWKAENLALVGPLSSETIDEKEIVEKRIKSFSKYKNFIDQQKYAEQFDSRSNLHSSVLEEFMYYLFKDMVSELSNQALIGKACTFKDIFFMPSSYKEMIASPHAKIEEKDHDFVIGVNLSASFQNVGSKSIENHKLQLPAVAIECKTYLDKTMLEGSSTAAEQLKYRNPNAIYFVVAEWLKLTEQVNLRKFKVDQIYILRKQKNTDREFRYEADYTKNPIYHDVVLHLVHSVRKHLTEPWEGSISHGLSRGFLL
jgi:hypothetical protein